LFFYKQSVEYTRNEAQNENTVIKTIKHVTVKYKCKIMSNY